jgi:hypothetical protein
MSPSPESRLAKRHSLGRWVVVVGALLGVGDAGFVLWVNDGVHLTLFSSLIEIDIAVLIALVIEAKEAPFWAYGALIVALLVEVIMLSTVQGNGHAVLRYAVEALSGGFGIGCTGAALGGLLLASPHEPASLGPPPQLSGSLARRRRSTG